MMTTHKLYMVLIGCTPKGRFTEQHDIFFGIGNSLKELVPQMKAFWPEAKGKIHIDAWREVTAVDGFSITIMPKTTFTNSEKLFFINLGGYKENDFEEYHYKTLTVAKTMGIAVKKSKATTFYKHFSFDGANSHIDDKYSLDVDDIHDVTAILALTYGETYSIQITTSATIKKEDQLHIGYVKIDAL